MSMSSDVFLHYYLDGKNRYYSFLKRDAQIWRYVYHPYTATEVQQNSHSKGTQPSNSLAALGIPCF